MRARKPHQQHADVPKSHILYHLDPLGLVLLRDHLDAYWSLALGAFERAATWRQKGRVMAVESELSILKQLEFEHRHLERYGEHAERMRAVLDGPNGAVGVVNAYAAAAGRR